MTTTTSTTTMTLTEFEAASKWLSSSSSASHLDNDTRLELYGLYKYGLSGVGPTGKRPGIFHFEARHKHDAWARVATAFGGRPDDAKSRYVEIARESGWKGLGVPHSPTPSGSSGSGEDGEGRKKGGGGGMGFGPSVSMMEREEESGEGGSPLHDAASAGDVIALANLIEDDNINARDDYGFTPLHLAADRGRVDAVKLLLKRGADKSVLDPDGQTAHDIAAVSGRDEIVAILQ